MTLSQQAKDIASRGYMPEFQALELLQNGSSYNEIIEFYSDDSCQ